MYYKTIVFIYLLILCVQFSALCVVSVNAFVTMFKLLLPRYMLHLPVCTYFHSLPTACLPIMCYVFYFVFLYVSVCLFSKDRKKLKQISWFF